MDSPADSLLLILVIALVVMGSAPAQTSQSQSTPSGSSSSVQHARKAAAAADSGPEAGSVRNGGYRNLGFGFTCKIPAGWVLRTEEMNASAEGEAAQASRKSARVLLAAFSRPPEAKGEDVNSSILIAAESASAYPGLKEAAQYFGPVTEIAEQQGFDVINEAYEFVIGTKTVVRSDFQKDVGSRVMLQSTLVVLARGYAVSFTFIGGTEDEVEELIAGLSFGVGAKAAAR
jgi:hypothetical protein